MRFRLLVGVMLVASACQREAEPPSDASAPQVVEASVPPAEVPAAPEPSAPPVAPESTTTATNAGPEKATGFNPEAVPESTAVLPSFPMLRAPDGLASVLGPREKVLGMGRQRFLAGDGLVTVEGEVWRDRYLLESRAQPMSAVAFHRHYEQIITGLGGHRISDGQFSEALLAAHGGREAVANDTAGAPPLPENEHATFLIRQRGQEYWIAVSTGTVPLHGFLVVLQRTASTP